MEFPKQLEISVTEKDIVGGERRCSRRCPVALAAIRALNEQSVPHELFCISVGIEDIVISDMDGTIVKYPLPDAAQRFIAAFDNAPGAIPHPIEPFQFQATSAPYFKGNIDA